MGKSEKGKKYIRHSTTTATKRRKIANHEECLWGKNMRLFPIWFLGMAARNQYRCYFVTVSKFLLFFLFEKTIYSNPMTDMHERKKYKNKCSQTDYLPRMIERRCILVLPVLHCIRDSFGSQHTFGNVETFQLVSL